MVYLLVDLEGPPYRVRMALLLYCIRIWKFLNFQVDKSRRAIRVQAAYCSLGVSLNCPPYLSHASP